MPKAKCKKMCQLHEVFHEVFIPTTLFPLYERWERGEIPVYKAFPEYHKDEQMLLATGQCSESRQGRGGIENNLRR